MKVVVQHVKKKKDVPHWQLNISYFITFMQNPYNDLFLFRRPKVKGENPDLKVS